MSTLSLLRAIILPSKNLGATTATKKLPVKSARLVSMPETATAPITFGQCPKCQNQIGTVPVYPVYVGDDKSDRENHMFRCDACGHFQIKTVKYR
ncbi:MAG TPA: hypothetical protein VK832_04020 [Burkholderiaceae bacterium]|nr:hypothetical protein [Burkholderiaceae bacterium]